MFPQMIPLDEIYTPVPFHPLHCQPSHKNTLLPKDVVPSSVSSSQETNLATTLMISPSNIVLSCWGLNLLDTITEGEHGHALHSRLLLLFREPRIPVLSTHAVVLPVLRATSCSGILSPTQNDTLRHVLYDYRSYIQPFLPPQTLSIAHFDDFVHLVFIAKADRLKAVVLDLAHGK